MNKKYKRVCRALHYFEHFFIFIAAVIGCVSVFTFASLVQIPISLMAFTAGLKICAITAEI